MILEKLDYSPIPIGSWVKAKRSGGIRYITKQINKKCFEDDGKLSKQSPSIHCYYSNYEKLN